MTFILFSLCSGNEKFLVSFKAKMYPNRELIFNNKITQRGLVDKKFQELINATN
jgi:hypothetical protein